MSLELSGTTGVKGVAGSVSAPSIVGDDTNTGISFPSADTIKFSTGGVERMAITNSGVTGISPGITMADQWKVSTSQTTSSDTLADITGWARNTNNFAGIGSALTNSGANFTFPSTGYYYVEFNLTGYRGAGSQIYNITQYIRTTTSGDTSSGTDYNLSNNTSMYSPANNSHYTQSARMIVKCSNTSNDKVFFGVQAEASIYIQGNTSESFTYAVFIKLADI